MTELEQNPSSAPEQAAVHSHGVETDHANSTFAGIEEASPTVDGFQAQSGAASDPNMPPADESRRSSAAARPDLLADAKRYRKRAQSAEKDLESARLDLAAREKLLAEKDQTIDDLQRRQVIDRALIKARVLDLDAAHALIERETLGTERTTRPTDAEIAALVHELQRRKPYLFRQSRPFASSGVMSARVAASQTPHAEALDDAAIDALHTGKRIDLLRYLRLKRRA